MEILEKAYDFIQLYIPTGITLVLVVIIIAASRFMIARKYKGTPKLTLHRQTTTLILSLIGLLAVIMIFPFKDSSARGQLLSLIGIVLSAAIALSSTTFLGNIMAGMMLRIIRGFRTGDFIKVEEYFGRVSERGLFHIEIQSEDRDLTTIPNMFLVTHPVKVIRSSGTILSAEVSLGYDISRKKVETALIEAASGAGLSDPFVHILQLGDFSITYRVSGLLEDVKHIITIRSQLRAKMLDACHKAGIEIVSPTFMNTRAVREGRQFIPPIERIDSEEANTNSEAIAFDKAEEAESLENLRQHIENVEAKIEELKALPPADITDKERLEQADEIEKLNLRKQRLEAVIKKRESQQEK